MKHFPSVRAGNHTIIKHGRQAINISNMKIVVIGGTGLIGSQVVSGLKDLGHEVVAASPSSGVNSITGEGLSEVLQDAEVVVDVPNSPSFEAAAVMDFFTTSEKNLLAAAKTAGVKHYVALSIVGVDRDGANPYFLAKLAQENLIKSAGIPYSLLRATQFYEFVGGIAASGTVGTEIHVSPAIFQPVASSDVVAALVDMANGSPLNGTAEVAGPDKIALDEIVKQYLKLKGDNREVQSDPGAFYFGAAVDDSTLVPGENPIIGRYSYTEWINIPGNLR